MTKREAQRRKKLRKAARYAKNFAGPYEGYDHGSFVRSKPCLLRSIGHCLGPVAACHVVPRGRRPGEDNWKSTVPFCAAHHTYYDVVLANDAGRFKEKHHFDLEYYAAKLVEEGTRKK